MPLRTYAYSGARIELEKACQSSHRKDGAVHGGCKKQQLSGAWVAYRQIHASAKSGQRAAITYTLALNTPLMPMDNQAREERGECQQCT